MTRPSAPAKPPAPARPASCGLCGGRRLVREFDARGLPAECRFALLRCPDCGLGRTEPMVPASEIGRWYPPAYYGRENVRFNPVFERLVRWFRRRRARVIARRASAGPVLDVGCGRGFILSNLRELGFEPRGLELTETGAWHARHKLGIDVHVGDFAEAPYGDGAFRAIVFWHSLEHMSAPLEALARAHRLLASGGLLVAAVPNSDSLQARWSRSGWFHLDIPRHCFHFSARSLALALEKAGFRVVQEDHFSFEQNPYGWLQSLYNMLGLEFNFFYNFLKNRTSRITPIKKHPFQACAVVLLLPVLLPLSLALTVLEAGLRRGGTIELYAVKAAGYAPGAGGRMSPPTSGEGPEGGDAARR